MDKREAIKEWLIANVWDGEDRYEAEGDWMRESPKGLQELVEECLEDVLASQQEAELVGRAKRGFDFRVTVAEFSAEAVPAGTKLYTHPSPTAQDSKSPQSSNEDTVVWLEAEVVRLMQENQKLREQDSKGGVPEEWQTAAKVALDFAECPAAAKYPQNCITHIEGLAGLILSAAPSIAEKAEWTYLKDRSLTAADGDYRGEIWALWEFGDGSFCVELENVARVRMHPQIVAFMPTGLQRPLPPEET